MWWFNPMIVFAKHYLTKFRKPLIYTAVAIGIFVAGFGAGWVAKSDQVADEASKKSDKEVAAIVKTVIQRDEVERKVYVEDLARIRKLQAENTRLSGLIDDLQERVPYYVPEDPSGSVGNYLSVGAVRLLDAAAAGSAASTAPAAEPDGSDLSPSSVTWRSFVSQELDVRERYNLARNQCNALIEWVEDNVVNKPAQ